MPHLARDTRYVLVLRDVDMNRIGVMSTQRSLHKLAPIHRSLFRLYASAVRIDVLLPWPPSEKLEDQEIIVNAERATDFTDAINWPKERDLKAIEAEIEPERKIFVTSIEPAEPAPSTEDNTQDSEARHQFLEDTVDDPEYNAYLEHIHTPKASEY